jgi:hypothetical protein
VDRSCTVVGAGDERDEVASSDRAQHCVFVQQALDAESHGSDAAWRLEVVHVTTALGSLSAAHSLTSGVCGSCTQTDDDRDLSEALQHVHVLYVSRKSIVSTASRKRLRSWRW